MFGLSSIATYAILAAVIFSAGTYSGYKITHNAWEADQVKVLEANQIKYQAALDKIAAADAQLQTLKAINEKNTNDLKNRAAKIITRPVYLNVCFDDDGLRIANDALSNRPQTQSGPVNTVPNAAGAAGLKGGNSVTSPNR